MNTAFERLQGEPGFCQLLGGTVAGIHQIDRAIDDQRIGRLGTLGFGNGPPMRSERDERVAVGGCHARAAQGQDGEQRREEHNWLCHRLQFIARRWASAQSRIISK